MGRAHGFFHEIKLDFWTTATALKSRLSWAILQGTNTTYEKGNKPAQSSITRVVTGED